MKEVDFAYFVMFSALLVLFFCEAVILYSLFCSKTAPIFFCVLLNLWFEKLKLCQILLMLDWFHA